MNKLVTVLLMFVIAGNICFCQTPEEWQSYWEPLEVYEQLIVDNGDIKAYYDLSIAYVKNFDDRIRCSYVLIYKWGWLQGYFEAGGAYLFKAWDPWKRLYTDVDSFHKGIELDFEGAIKGVQDCCYDLSFWYREGQTDIYGKGVEYLIAANTIAQRYFMQRRDFCRSLDSTSGVGDAKACRHFEVLRDTLVFTSEPRCLSSSCGLVEQVDSIYKKSSLMDTYRHVMLDIPKRNDPFSKRDIASFIVVLLENNKVVNEGSRYILYHLLYDSPHLGKQLCSEIKHACPKDLADCMQSRLKSLLLEEWMWDNRGLSLENPRDINSINGKDIKLFNKAFPYLKRFDCQ